MKRGFIPLVIIAIIGLASVLTAGGGYAVYKYNEVTKEKAVVEAQLDEQKERELEQLRGKVEELESKNDSATSTEEVPEVKESTKVIAPKTESTPKPSVTKTQVSTPEQSGSGVSSKDMTDTIDIWIEQSKGFSGSINEYIATIDYYSGTALESNKAASILINDEDDPYLLSMWKYLSTITGDLIGMSKSLKNGTKYKDHTFHGTVPELTNSVNEYIAGLIKKKSEIPEYYANDEIYKTELMKLIDYQYVSYGKVMDEIHYAQNDYLEAVKLLMSAMSKTQPDVQAYMSSQKISNTNIINTVIHQPVTTPQIQMPKTTYCDMHETGARNFYSISCNTY